MEEMVKYLKALVFLQLQATTGNAAFEKPELLLAQAGFVHREIAEILGKKPGAVAKVISRAKKAQGDLNETE